MENWHVWTITTNRYKRVVEYLEELSFIREFLYPLSEKEYNTKRGVRRRKFPLYANYIFIKYDHSLETSSLLQECSWIIQYIGKCSKQEITQVRELSAISYSSVTQFDILGVGAKVKMVQTPFAGWDAEVLEQDGNNLLVSIRIFGGEQIIKCCMEDVNITE